MGNNSPPLSFSDVEMHSDVKTITQLPYVDLLTGGFPCQPFSVAGKRKGKGDDRYLWPEMLRIIRTVHPRWLIAENVPGIDDKTNMVLDTVISDLERIGYEAIPIEIPACAVGAPHIRQRVWIIAYSSKQRSHNQENKRELEKERGGELLPIQSRNSADVAYSKCQRGQGREIHRGNLTPTLPGGTTNPLGTGGEDVADAEKPGLQVGGFSGRGQAPHSRLELPSQAESACWWTTEPDVGRVAYGIPKRVDRLRALGNAIVPQVAEWIIRQIVEADRG